jgi:hypothetical protein
LLYDNGTQVGVNTTSPVSLLSVNKNALGVTVVDNSGLTLHNTTAAAVGAQQISPALHFESNGWGTTAGTSQSTDWIMYSIPVQSTVPTVNLIFASSVAGAAYTTRATLTSAGGLTVSAFAATTGAFSSTLSAVTTATLTRTALVTTSTDGVIVTNTTAALVGTQVQISPRIRLSGTAWNTGTSLTNTTNFIIENLPAAGNPPTSTLKFGYFDTTNATVVYPFTLSNAGAATFSSSVTAGGGLISTGSPNGYPLGELQFSLTTAGSYAGISTNGTTTPTLYFDHRATSNTGNFVFRNGTGGASTLMYIAGSGNVGIGTTSPAATLHVLSPNAQSSIIATTNATTLYQTFRYNTSTDVGYIGNGAGVASGGSAGDFGLQAVANMVFATGASAPERMRITSGGLVGIGTTGPSYTLDIVGNMRLSFAGTTTIYNANSTASTTGWWSAAATSQGQP